jgi:hypothetical protein
MTEAEQIKNRIAWYSQKLKEYSALLSESYDDEYLEMRIMNTISIFKSKLEELHEELILHIRTIEDANDNSQNKENT